jgi:hypothetical protein
MKRDDILKDVSARAGRAVARYWETRATQRDKQKQTGKADQGLRSAVTGGAQMDGFIDLFTELIVAAGIPTTCVHRSKDVELPGFFRPTKEWDLVVVRENTLLVAIEAKSQVGPSFGNNFNNRTEEAMGSAVDLWAAYRNGTFLHSPQPFVGYFFMLEDCDASQSPVKVREPHFKVAPDLSRASYTRLYELFCHKLVWERYYTTSAFITSSAVGGLNGVFKRYGEDLSIESFARKLLGHVSIFL